jgi:hypothetical protein
MAAGRGCKAPAIREERHGRQGSEEWAAWETMEGKGPDEGNWLGRAARKRGGEEGKRLQRMAIVGRGSRNETARGGCQGDATKGSDATRRLRRESSEGGAGKKGLGREGVKRRATWKIPGGKCLECRASLRNG